MIGSHSPSITVLYDGALVVEAPTDNRFEVRVRRLADGTLRIRTRRAQ